MKNVRKIAIGIFATILLSANVLLAGSPPEPAAVSQADLYKTIEHVMNYPENARLEEESGKVWVTFEVGENGKIETKNVQGEQKFVNHVKKELNNIVVENPYLHGQTYMIKIAFNYEKR